MNDLQVQFIPYEQAVELKKLGFNEECFGNYSKLNGDFIIYTSFFGPTKNINTDTPEHLITAPLWQQAFDWFRCEKEIDISIDVYYSEKDSYKHGGYLYLIYEFKNLVLKSANKEGECASYEEARLECLKKLIEIVKESK